MTTLAEELTYLFRENEQVRNIARLSRLTTPETLACSLCEFGRKNTPQTDCDFWNRFRGLDVWHIAYFGTDAQKRAVADWLRAERNERQVLFGGNAWQPV